MRVELACSDGVGSLMDYFEGVLQPVARAAIDAHLAICPRCVAFVRSYGETPRIFRDALPAPMPAGLGERVLGFLRDRLRNPPQ